MLRDRARVDAYKQALEAVTKLLLILMIILMIVVAFMQSINSSNYIRSSSNNNDNSSATHEFIRQAAAPLIRGATVMDIVTKHI